MACPLCLEALREVVTTPCAHQFCSECLDKWVKTGNRSCPLCRTQVYAEPAPLLIPPGPSLRERMEWEDVARSAALARRQALESRLDAYRTSFFTPSGRPIESLPVVSLEEMRRLLNRNPAQALSLGDC
ncbi:hypothetical protein AB1Y20_018548 [Prymnesium parvum]|uniref:RING-type domain-containing protein n=1 Tax=Prymnesium parvum TaxID=97485 RepID=A0AB34JRV8_PRYPA